ncbi:DUF2264 domain-containing protein [Methanobrevibacter oralis]|uniref:DUF2264 domain-containing protein n=1 Tax=Methanobrevibacter oralis TaxID=66851 RepID=A0A166BVZ6_METOA|nr:DUF2264 domain-containing protein [Methanobrevibacter oralis]KZX13870.1 hypothetical protein MBORA_02750 [Methanobrevibacter oralis]
MNNSFLGRFKKKDKPLIEDEVPILEDRIFWVSTLQKIAFPVLNNLSKSSLKKKMPYESSSLEGQKFVYLEAFACVFNGISPWLELGADDSEEGIIREKYIYLTIKAIANAVNPKNNDYIFVIEPKQSLMDVALFAQGLLRSKNQIWLNLPMDVQARIISELKKTRIIAPYENHWLLFTSIIEAALLEFTGECDKERLVYGVRKFRDELYVGDSFYADGEQFNLDFYNSLIIHPMLNDILIIMRKYGISEGEFLDVQLMRSSRHAAQLERMISSDGNYPLIGKSLSYRCGIFHLLSQSALLKILPKNINPAQVRSALTKVLRVQFQDNQNFDENGWLKIGLNGNQLDISESDINTGSLYFCCSVFLALGLDFNDSFWSNPFAEWSSLKAWNSHKIEKDQSIDF